MCNAYINTAAVAKQTHIVIHNKNKQAHCVPEIKPCSPQTRGPHSYLIMTFVLMKKFYCVIPCNIL